MNNGIFTSAGLLVWLGGIVLHFLVESVMASKLPETIADFLSTGSRSNDQTRRGTYYKYYANGFLHGDCCRFNLLSLSSFDATQVPPPQGLLKTFPENSEVRTMSNYKFVLDSRTRQLVSAWGPSFRLQLHRQEKGFGIFKNMALANSVDTANCESFCDVVRAMYNEKTGTQVGANPFGKNVMRNQEEAYKKAATQFETQSTIPKTGRDIVIEDSTCETCNFRLPASVDCKKPEKFCVANAAKCMGFHNSGGVSSSEKCERMSPGEMQTADLYCIGFYNLLLFPGNVLQKEKPCSVSSYPEIIATGFAAAVKEDLESRGIEVEIFRKPAINLTVRYAGDLDQRAFQISTRQVITQIPVKISAKAADNLIINNALNEALAKSNRQDKRNLNRHATKKTISCTENGAERGNQVCTVTLIFKGVARWFNC